MRAGVHDLFGGEGVRQMGMRADIAKAKLQHGHAGNLQPLAQFVHVGRDVSQIFGEKWKAA